MKNEQLMRSSFTEIRNELNIKKEKHKYKTRTCV